MKKYLNYIISAGIVLVSFVLFMLLEFDVISFGTKWVFPWFFVFLAIGFGLFFMVKAFMSRNKLNFIFVSTALMLFALIYILAALTRMEWYIILVCALAYLFFMFFIGLAAGVGRTYDKPDNEQEGYKTYFERKAEREAAEKNEPEEELPEIKSFKDEDK